MWHRRIPFSPRGQQIIQRGEVGGGHHNVEFGSSSYTKNTFNRLASSVNGQNLVLLAIATREGRNGATLPALDYPRALQENSILFP